MASQFTSVIGMASILEGFADLQDTVGDDAVYLVGTNVEYGIYLEFGTSQMRSYPWLRPAVDEFKSSPARFVARHTGMSIDAIDSTDDAIRVVALALERAMVENVSAGRPGGRSPGTHPDHPARQTGNLAGSISAEKVQ